MAAAKTGDTVKVNYTGKFADGKIFDSSVNKQPLQFIIGQGQVIPGFEQAAVGMNPGESKTVQIPAAAAYGPLRPELVLTVGKENFPPELNPQVGQMLQVGQADGTSMVVKVTGVSEAGVTLDANHPLAGKDLTFDISLVAIV
ncbi:MAG: peptidylprolyl isomerase [Dehalococcoidales bacterium]|nr:peptidylprolyl isomerase [Dehalococcoidales bacterium]